MITKAELEELVKKHPGDTYYAKMLADFDSLDAEQLNKLDEMANMQTLEINLDEYDNELNFDLQDSSGASGLHLNDTFQYNKIVGSVKGILDYVDTNSSFYIGISSDDKPLQGIASYGPKPKDGFFIDVPGKPGAKIFIGAANLKPGSTLINLNYTDAQGVKHSCKCIARVTDGNLTLSPIPETEKFVSKATNLTLPDTKQIPLGPRNTKDNSLNSPQLNLTPDKPEEKSDDIKTENTDDKKESNVDDIDEEENESQIDNKEEFDDNDNEDETNSEVDDEEELDENDMPENTSSKNSAEIDDEEELDENDNENENNSEVDEDEVLDEHDMPDDPLNQNIDEVNNKTTSNTDTPILTSETMNKNQTENETKLLEAYIEDQSPDDRLSKIKNIKGLSDNEKKLSNELQQNIALEQEIYKEVTKHVKNSKKLTHNSFKNNYAINYLYRQALTAAKNSPNPLTGTRFTKAVNTSFDTLKANMMNFKLIVEENEKIKYIGDANQKKENIENFLKEQQFIGEEFYSQLKTIYPNLPDLTTKDQKSKITLDDKSIKIISDKYTNKSNGKSI